MRWAHTTYQGIRHRRCSVSMMDLGDIAYHQGAYERGATLYAEGLALSRVLGDPYMIARILDGSGRLALAQGAADRAVARHREGPSLARSAGVSCQVVNGLEGIAAAVWGQGHAERSVRLLGVVERMLMQGRQHEHLPGSRVGGTPSRESGAGRGLTRHPSERGSDRAESRTRDGAASCAVEPARPEGAVQADAEQTGG